MAHEFTSDMFSASTVEVIPSTRFQSDGNTTTGDEFYVEVTTHVTKPYHYHTLALAARRLRDEIISSRRSTATGGAVAALGAVSLIREAARATRGKNSLLNTVLSVAAVTYGLNAVLRGLEAYDQRRDTARSFAKAAKPYKPKPSARGLDSFHDLEF